MSNGGVVVRCYPLPTFMHISESIIVLQIFHKSNRILLSLVFFEISSKINKQNRKMKVVEDVRLITVKKRHNLLFNNL